MSTTVESPMQMARRLVQAYPKVPEMLGRSAAAGLTPDVDVVRTWLTVFGPDVRAVLDENPRVNMLPGAELDAIVEEVTFVCAHLECGLDDAEFITEWAMHAALDRRRETAPVASSGAAVVEPMGSRRDVAPMVTAVLAWSPFKPRAARTRRVRVCADVTDSRGRVTVPEDTYGVALDWPVFGPVMVEFLDRHGRPVRARVLRRELAVVGE